jgi:hypothetical protein
MPDGGAHHTGGRPRPVPPHGDGRRPVPPHGDGRRPVPPHGDGRRPVPPHGDGRRSGPPHGDGRRSGPPHGDGRRSGPPHGDGRRSGPPLGDGRRLPVWTAARRRLPSRTGPMAGERPEWRRPEAADDVAAVSCRPGPRRVRRPPAGLRCLVRHLATWPNRPTASGTPAIPCLAAFPRCGRDGRGPGARRGARRGSSRAAGPARTARRSVLPVRAHADPSPARPPEAYGTRAIR